MMHALNAEAAKSSLLPRRGMAGWTIWALSLAACLSITWQFHHLQIESVKFLYPRVYYTIEGVFYLTAFLSYATFTGMTLWLDKKFRPYPVYSIMIWLAAMLFFNAMNLRFHGPDMLDESYMYYKAVTDPYGLRKDHFHLSADGSMLEIHDNIEYGFTGTLTHILDANPGVRTVSLTSYGGVAAEGIWMGRVIRARGLDTVTDSYCVSSCGFAFMGSVHRRVEGKGYMGFHRPSIVATPWEYEKIVAFMKAYFIQNGATQAFTDEALSHVFRNPWYPPRDKLVEGHIIN